MKTCRECACGTPYEDERRRCWKCNKRPCSACGMDTGSVFIELCIACGNRDASEALPYEPKPVAKPVVKPPAAPRRKSAKTARPKPVQLEPDDFLSDSTFEDFA